MKGSDNIEDKDVEAGNIGILKLPLKKYTSKKNLCRFLILLVTFEEVDFLWNRTVDSLKTSFHLLL